MEKVPGEVRPTGADAVRAAEHAWRPTLAPQGAASRNDLTFLDVLTTCLRHRRLIVGLPLVLTLLAVVATLTARRQYTSRGSFMPRGSDVSKLAGLGGIAAQIGVNLPTGDAGQSPDFYADLVMSRQVLGAVVTGRYHPAGLRDTAGVDLATLLESPGNSPQERREEAIRELTKRIAVSKNIRSGVLEVSARTRWPEVSQQIVAQVLALVNEFNLRQRQEKAQADRQFAEDRLLSIRSELYRAEEAVADFGRRNHAYRGSPDLSTEYERLTRAVTMRQQLFTSFSQLYEQARIDALRTSPLIMIIDHPEIAARADSRQGVLKVLLALLTGLVIALVIAFGRELAAAHEQSSPDAFARFVEARRQASSDLRHPLRALLGRRSVT